MPNPTPDLWPEIEQSQITPPVAILREQAAALGRKTNNLLEGRVETSVEEMPSESYLQRVSNETLGVPNTYVRLFRHRFLIVAPALGDYTYELFWIAHGVEQYPVTAPNPRALFQDVPYPRQLPPELQFTLSSEKDLIQYIRDLLNSNETRRIIGSLLAQVKATA